MGDAVVQLRSGSGCGLRSKVGVEKGASVSSACRIQPLTFYRTTEPSNVQAAMAVGVVCSWSLLRRHVTPLSKADLHPMESSVRFAAIR
jgi:hypothetical protein